MKETAAERAAVGDDGDNSQGNSSNREDNRLGLFVFKKEETKEKEDWIN